MLSETEGVQIITDVYLYGSFPISAVGFVGNILIFVFWHREEYHPSRHILMILAVAQNVFMFFNHLCYFVDKEPCYRHQSVLHYIAYSTLYFVITSSLFMIAVHYFWMFHVQKTATLTSRRINAALVFLWFWSLFMKAVPQLAKRRDDLVRIYFTLIGVALPSLIQCILAIILFSKHRALSIVSKTSSSTLPRSTAMSSRLSDVPAGRFSRPHDRPSLHMPSTHGDGMVEGALTNHSLRGFLIPRNMLTPSSDHSPLSTKRPSFELGSGIHRASFELGSGVHRLSFEFGSSVHRPSFDLPMSDSQRRRSSGMSDTHPISGGISSMTSGSRRFLHVQPFGAHRMHSGSVADGSSHTKRLSLIFEKSSRQISLSLGELAITKAVTIVSFIPMFLFCVSLVGYSTFYFLPTDHKERPKRFLFRAAFVIGLYTDFSYRFFLYLFLFKSVRRPFKNMYRRWRGKTQPEVRVEQISSPKTSRTTGTFQHGIETLSESDTRISQQAETTGSKSLGSGSSVGGSQEGSGSNSAYSGTIGSFSGSQNTKNTGSQDTVTKKTGHHGIKKVGSHSTKNTGSPDTVSKNTGHHGVTKARSHHTKNTGSQDHVTENAGHHDTKKAGSQDSTNVGSQDIINEAPPGLQ